MHQTPLNNMASRMTLMSTAILAVLLAANSASAHFLWVTIGAGEGDHGAANVIFEHGAAPGDGGYLGPFVERGKTWIRTVDKPKAQPLKVEQTEDKKGNKWLIGDIPAAAPRCIDSFGTFGVYRYGKTDVLLHYYAKYLDVTRHDDLHELGRAEQQTLDIEPHDHEDVMFVKVYFNGKPAAGRQVFVLGPKGFRETVKTNSRGQAQFKPGEPGRYFMRTNVELEEGGKFDGKEYSKIRHHATLIMTLPLEE